MFSLLWSIDKSVCRCQVTQCFVWCDVCVGWWVYVVCRRSYLRVMCCKYVWSMCMCVMCVMVCELCVCDVLYCECVCLVGVWHRYMWCVWYMCSVCVLCCECWWYVCMASSVVCAPICVVNVCCMWCVCCVVKVRCVGCCVWGVCVCGI